MPTYMLSSLPCFVYSLTIHDIFLDLLVRLEVIIEVIYAIFIISLYHSYLYMPTICVKCTSQQIIRQTVITIYQLILCKFSILFITCTPLPLLR